MNPLADANWYGLGFNNTNMLVKSPKWDIQVSKTGSNNVAEAFKDNVVLDYAGLPAGDLDRDQRAIKDCGRIAKVEAVFSD